MKRFSSGIFSQIASVVSLMKKNALLFFGDALFLLGVFGWSNGKYCDGNAADYYEYSCTNPAVYYYYGAFALAAIIIGSFFAIAWFLKKSDTQ
ncbi:MAG: hypothetical protein WCT48_04780 [Candidatus Paceibacterota bacterium]|jgi:hypothetical protein